MTTEIEDDDTPVNLDEQLTNADWTKAAAWDLPRTLPKLMQVVPDPVKLLDMPAGEQMPRRIRSGLENMRRDEKISERRKVAKAKPAPHTGAMVALIPSAKDLATLGNIATEPMNELHCTMYFMGEIADLREDEAERLRNKLAVIAQHIPTMPCRVAGLAEFNPTGEKPAHVLILNERNIAAVKRRIASLVERIFTDELVDQHEPFIPHVTLAYGEEGPDVPAGVFDNPLTLDTLRLAWGDEVTDYPLAGNVSETMKEE